MLPPLARFAALALGYFLLAALGLRWATLSGAASPVFPAAGLALAGLLLWGVRFWPAILLGRLLAGIAEGSTLPLWAEAGIAGGNTLAAVAGTVLLQRGGVDAALTRLRDVLTFLAIAVVHSALAAVIGIAVLVTATGADLRGAFVPGLSWWIGNVSGVLLVAPLILGWNAHEPRSVSRAWHVHLWLSTAAAFVAAWVIFGPSETPLLRTFLVFPLLVWAAVACGVRGAATALLPVAVVAIWGTTMGYGPMVDEASAAAAPYEFLLLQQFIIVAAATALVLAVVADERRAREALRETKEQLSLVLDAGELGFWDWDVRSGTVRYGGHFASMLGYPAHEFRPHISAWSELVHPEDVEPGRRALDAHLEGRTELYECEQRLRHRDGSWRWVLTRGRTVQRDGQGQALRVVGTLTDMTARKRIDEALRASETLTRTIAENSTQGVAMMDERGYCTYANPAWLAMTGYTAEEIGSKPLHDLVHHHYPDGRPYPKNECPIDRALPENYDVRAHEDLFFRKDGTTFRVSCAASPIFREGRPVATVVEIRDVTAERAAEAALRDNEQRLRKAVAEAEQANRLKDEFLSTLSHELRTPVNAIAGWSKLLKDTGAMKEPEALRGLDAIDRNARVQMRLVEDLLDMSRIVAGKLRLDVRDVDLQDVVNDALAAIVPSIEARQLRIQRQTGGGSTAVRVDPGRMQQVVWNLLSNAIKFTPPGGTIGVRLDRLHATVRLTVSDTGQGIAPDFLPLVFDRFRQADASTTRSHAGLGLGLAIARSIVELHGGTIRAESAGRDQGATFTVELPPAHPVGLSASSTISAPPADRH